MLIHMNTLNIVKCRSFYDFETNKYLSKCSIFTSLIYIAEPQIFGKHLNFAEIRNRLRKPWQSYLE